MAHRTKLRQDHWSFIGYHTVCAAVFVSFNSGSCGFMYCFRPHLTEMKVSYEDLCKLSSPDLFHGHWVPNY